MEIQEFSGLRIAFAGVKEALRTDYSALRGRADLVRVISPPAGSLAALAAVGFMPKPHTLTWIAATRESEDAFLIHLSQKDRQNIRIARRRAVADGLHGRIVRPVDARFLDDFLPLYRARIAEMRHGDPIAAEYRDAVLHGGYYALACYDGTELAGGCLIRECPSDDLAEIRFSAVDLRRRSASLARVLYLDAVRTAGELGYRRVSLGSDPNLYGHLAKPGLFGFKWRMGFEAVPAQSVLPDKGFDEADLILSISELDQPVVLLSYAQNDPDSRAADRRGLRAEIFSGPADIDTRPYAAPFLTELRIHYQTAPTKS